MISFQENNNLNIVTKFYNEGELRQYINSRREKNEKINEELILIFFVQITLGLAAILKLKILYRDLKALNIFLSENSEVKIGDLEVVKILNQRFIIYHLNYITKNKIIIKVIFGLWDAFYMN